MSTESDIALSLVIPVYNEEVNLDELIRRCMQVCTGLERPFEIVLVDDGSADTSPAIIADAAARQPGRLVGVLLNRNYGQHAAVMAGFAHSRGEVVVTLDADLQNPPEEIPKLLGPIAEGCDVVGSVRQNRRDTLFRRLSSRLVNYAVRRATGVNMHDYGCMLRAYRRSVVDAMLQCHERSTFIPVLANGFASRTAEVDVAHAGRGEDQSKYTLWKLLNLQFDLLTSMSAFPLRLLSVLGGGVALLGFVFSLVLLVARLFYGAQWAVEGVFTLFAVLFVFVGMQLLGLGLLGEYIGRIYNDVRARPRYFVRALLDGKPDAAQPPSPAVDSPRENP
jgi:undecaprenyl-phosphate 4-deoxy-4-formamido-L-arabinose transferase